MKERMRFKLFGWYVFMSRRPMKVQDRRGKSRSIKRDEVKRERLARADYKCEICGNPIDVRCTLHHLLNAGMPDRNAVENVMVLCPECNHELEKHPHYHGIKHLEDEARCVVEMNEKR